MKGITACAIQLILVAVFHQACRRPQTKSPSAQVQSTTQAAPSAQATDSAKVFSGDGVVEGVDKSVDQIQINHGEIKGYMPAMSMPYRVKDKAMLDMVKAGDKVSFTLEDTAKGAVLIEIKKTAP